MDTIEEKVSFLFEEIGILKENNNKLKILLEDKIHGVTTKLKAGLELHNNRITELNQIVNESIVGGVKLEVLGIFCVLYGVLIPVLWSS
jgi:hypothetical protein